MDEVVCLFGNRAEIAKAQEESEGSGKNTERQEDSVLPCRKMDLAVRKWLEFFFAKQTRNDQPSPPSTHLSLILVARITRAAGAIGKATGTPGERGSRTLWCW